MGYQATYDRSMDDPEGFWADAARLVDWTQPWERVLDDSRPPFYRWFKGRRAQHLLQRGGPPCAERPRRPSRDHPR